ncbi:ABC transporter permease [Clostridium sp. AM58-1XD]|uniref:ABC transporter permease n=1 Tax=Clostridium sp. AM58-1XD TaxID=2292307 RepID=UPI001FA8C0AC|nr:ABC transporter permease [Clostridium sp. AM58-1XD]
MTEEKRGDKLMGRYIAKRILIAGASLLAVLFILFLLMDLLPGSPFNDEKLTAAQLEILNVRYGLDRPFFVRFFTYAGRMLRGDLGISYSVAKNMPVDVLLAERLPVSLKIGGLSILTGGAAGILLGMAAAVKKNRAADLIAGAIAVIGVSLPSYVLALALSYTFGFRLKWFPLLYKAEAAGWSSVLPALALGVFMMAAAARVMRAEMIEVLESDYMMFAENRGLPGGRLIFVHGMRNALIPVIAVLAPMTAAVMTGSLAVEKIFSIPGAGSLMVTAIQANDYNVVAGLAFVYSAVYIAVMLAADLLYELLDPRIRITGERQTGRGRT